MAGIWWRNCVEFVGDAFFGKLVCYKLSFRKTFCAFLATLSLALFSLTQTAFAIELTPSEKNWIEEHPVIRIGIDGDYAPYSFQKSAGGYRGIAPDFVRHIESETGLKFEIMPDLTWPEIISGAKEKAIDVIATAVKTPKRDEFLNFSQIYINTPLVIMSQVGRRNMQHPTDLIGKRVALVKDYASTQRVLTDYPDIVPVYVDTPLQGLQAVAIDDADAYVGVLGVSIYVAQEYGLVNLRVASKYDLRNNGQRFAVRKDWPELVGIIDKVLSEMPLRKKNRITSNWIPILDDIIDRYNQTPPFVLDDEEKKWLRNNPEIKIGMMNAWPPMDYLDDSGQAKGIGVDLAYLFNKRLNGAIKLVPGDWGMLLGQLERGEIDALMDITPSASRRERLLFTTPYLNVPHVIFARKDSVYYNELDDLKGKTVALEEDFFLTNEFRKNHPSIEVKTYATTSDALDAVTKKQVDAYVGNRAAAMYVIRNELIDNLSQHGKLEETSSINAIAVRKDNPVLQAILQKALDSISLSEQRVILKDWVEDPQRKLLLSSEERSWLKAHPVIRVAADLEFPPVEYVDENGVFKGVAIDYLNELSERLGVTFEISKQYNWATSVEMVKDRELDMFSAAAPTISRKEYSSFTDPYLQLPLVIFALDSVPYIDGIAGLKNKKVAIVENYAVTENIRAGNWGLELVEVKTVEAGIDLLNAHEVDAYIGSILVTGQTLREKGLLNIRVAGQTPFKNEISMGVRSDWPEFAFIMKKALQSIPDEKHREIRNKWIGLQVEPEADYTIFWQITAGSLGILVLFFGWNTYLQRRMDLQSRNLRDNNTRLIHEVKERRKAEESANRANQAKDTFLTNLSHEFRTPLNAIIGYTEFMLMNKKKQLNEDKSSEYLNHIQSAGKHMLELVDDLMDLSVIDLGEMSLNEELTTTGDVIDIVKGLIEGKINSPKKTIHWHASDALPQVRVDIRHVKQILINLVENAIKFTPDGGTITIADHMTEVGEIVLSVKDTGIGIPEDEIDDILEVFNRGQDPLIRSSEGTGLGLTLCVRMAELHDGEIKVESKRGKGTTVSFIIPASRVVPN
ncbi:transporter substrate-binding domain-containing protein [Kiloniella majae]|uniref:transporter substrate-binding domain-containing protein n=1 Tax=Kiloniella majae TaxID=1938558 RepID=UPI000A278ACF|nr:transporter substrate-binding domain-containing protein [Kiloniella majae]